MALFACTLNIAASAAFAQSAPAAPTRLVATASKGKISLTWARVPGAKSYIIYRSTVSGSAYKTVGTPTDSRGTDSHPYGGMTYYYVVTAVNPSGESPHSAEVSAATPAPAAAPAAPTNLVVNALGNGKVSFSWTPVPDADSYIIYRSTTSGTGYKLIGTPIDSRGTESKAYNGTTYYYVVSAVNVKGEGPKSAEVSVITPGASPK